MVQNTEKIHSLTTLHRRLYVQEQKIEIGTGRLRLLEETLKGLDGERFVKALQFLEQFDQSFQNLVYSSLTSYLNVFTQ
ncbi:MAG: hypothetical protein OXB88_06595, partial [Bacteriovoracales bacterium]|nr:hypothetical protein [Bacteriovoracales bacterium]